MKLLKIILTVVMLAATAAANSTAVVPSLGKTEPARLRWKGRTIKLALSTSVIKPNPNIKPDSDVIGAVRRSMQAWQEVADLDLQLDITDKLSVSPVGSGGDGISLISIAQTPENVLLFSKNPQSESAKTRVFFNRKNNITEADIVLNPFQQFSTDGSYGTFDLEATLRHEIGHLLGLKHSGVLGSTMSDRQAKNGVGETAGNYSGRLSESDIAAIRELYGSSAADEDCCAAISGRLSGTNGRGIKSLKVWAEESGTGRVLAQSETGSDGSFKLAGMPTVDYGLFFQKRSEDGTAFASQILSGRTNKDDAAAVIEKLSVRPSDLSVDLIGTNSQLGESAIDLKAGNQYRIYLGGHSLDAGSVAITFTSPYIKLNGAVVRSDEFGDGIGALSVWVSIDPDTPDGSYSVFIENGSGAKTAMIGALRITGQAGNK